MSLLTVEARPASDRSPFSNHAIDISLAPGACVHLAGPSGSGKSTICSAIAGLVSARHLKRDVGVKVSCTWNSQIPKQERVGVLFQNSTLIDSLSLVGNVSVALDASTRRLPTCDRLPEVKRIIESVGLDFARDGAKAPGELSGGMLRRAALALQLAQRKRLIILDEPFTGLDREAAVSVANELRRLRDDENIALLLVSHQPEIVSLLVRPSDPVIKLLPRQKPPSSQKGTGSMSHHLFLRRFFNKLVDYFFWSLPLIALAFVASGLAISMLSADLLKRVDVTDTVLEVVEKEVKPLLSMVSGGSDEASPMMMMMVKMKVRAMLNRVVPQAKATIYAIGMAKLFVLEIGPLLTALLLSGRIGGSYAGEVGTMQATSQNKLLYTLGISPRWWTLGPSLLAALIAAPLLTLMGTGIALYLGSFVGTSRGIGTLASYKEQVEAAIWTTSPFDSEHLNVVDLMTYPPLHLLIKAMTFMLITISVSEAIGRWDPDLAPRAVPRAITQAVVVSGLMVIIADWGFSRILILRA